MELSLARRSGKNLTTNSMRFIIDRKVYNTETSEKLAEYWNGKGRQDFNGIEETLYRTKKGVFWLHYWGGAATAYAEAGYGHKTEGEGAKPLSEDEAYGWMERHGHDDLIERFFSDWLEVA